MLTSLDPRFFTEEFDPIAFVLVGQIFPLCLYVDSI